jgi:hypothetical protein
MQDWEILPAPLTHLGELRLGRAAPKASLRPELCRELSIGTIRQALGEDRVLSLVSLRVDAGGGGSSLRTSRFVLLAALPSFVVLTVLAVISYRFAQSERTEQSWVIHTYRVMDMTRTVMSDVENAETGQRGYLLTRQAQFLEPYRNGLRAVDTHLDQLQALTPNINWKHYIELVNAPPTHHYLVSSPDFFKVLNQMIDEQCKVENDPLGQERALWDSLSS